MKKNSRGFTLVELMIAVAIIGILGAVAYPAFTQYVKTAECTDATVALESLAGFMEDFYNNNDTYAGAVVASSVSPKGFYNMSISTQTLFLYTLTATPVDTTKKTITLDSLHQYSESGGATDAVSCL